MVGRRIKTWGMTGFGVKEGRDEAARDMDEPILLCLNLLRDLGEVDAREAQHF
jgi:hypothetical protein